MPYSPLVELVVIPIAVTEAMASGHAAVEPDHLLIGALKCLDLGSERLAPLLAGQYRQGELAQEIARAAALLAPLGQDPARLRRALRAVMVKGDCSPGQGGQGLSTRSRECLAMAELAASAQGRRHLTLGDLLLAALANPTPTLQLLLPGPRPPGADAEPVATATAGGRSPADPVALMGQLESLRSGLLERLVGQDHAVLAFVAGLFDAAILDQGERRKGTRGLFVFAGPPGVGKTYLAELGAEALGRPFKRFDMSGYADEMGVVLLAGAQRSYKDAKVGILTSFVSEHPDAVLLFDEIEKAHLGVIHLFLQLLDDGSLQDRLTEERVDFTGTLVILTTNAGRLLYEGRDGTGMTHPARDLHRRTILDALAQESDPRTGRHFFPQAIVSRLATGYPVLFEPLTSADLERITRLELQRSARLFEEQYGKPLHFCPELPWCLVMREGAQADARTLRAQAEHFVKWELFKLFSLLGQEPLRELLARPAPIRFALEAPEADAEARQLILSRDQRPRLLLAAGERVSRLLAGLAERLHLEVTGDPDQALALLARQDFDLVLLDLTLGAESDDQRPGPEVTGYLLGQLPPAARSLARGRELLHEIRARHPDLSCHLVVGPGLGIGDEVIQACVGSAGARGALELVPGHQAPDPLARIEDLARCGARDRQAAALGRQMKVLSFETAPKVDAAGEVYIRLRRLRLTTAVAAGDLAGLVGEAERPSIGFADVYGAEGAKRELGFLVEWLKSPRQYAALGLEPPRGILLYGAPGTGKTMLARALAGESRTAFIAESATAFVTKWVGSGPENVRALFQRARRYAPTILFIDEIDAIGRRRSGGDHHRPQEETLNAILTELDGFATSTQRPVILIAATNLVDSLDEALLRRFDREVEVDLPDRAARLAFLVSRLGGGTAQVSAAVLERLAAGSTGMSIAALLRVVQAARRMAAMAGSGVTDDLLEDAFELMRMGETRGRTDPATLLRVARHEAGHCLIAWLAGIRPLQVTIVARGAVGGYLERETEEGRMLITRPEIEDDIRIAMGGRAAEILYYGEQAGLSSGVAGDLRVATRWAERMVCEYGMSPEVGCVDLRGRPATGVVLEAVERIVAAQLARAIAELTAHRPVLDRLVERLLDANRLTREELATFMPPGEGAG